MWVPTLNEQVFDQEGSVYKIVFITTDASQVVTQNDCQELFIFDRFGRGKYRDQNDEMFFLIGPANDTVWSRFQELTEVHGE